MPNTTITISPPISNMAVRKTWTGADKNRRALIHDQFGGNVSEGYIGFRNDADAPVMSTLPRLNGGLLAASKPVPLSSGGPGLEFSIVRYDSPPANPDATHTVSSFNYFVLPAPPSTTTSASAKIVRTSDNTIWVVANTGSYADDNQTKWWKSTDDGLTYTSVAAPTACYLIPHPNSIAVDGTFLYVFTGNAARSGVKIYQTSSGVPVLVFDRTLSGRAYSPHYQVTSTADPVYKILVLHAPVPGSQEYLQLGWIPAPGSAIQYRPIANYPGGLLPLSNQQVPNTGAIPAFHLRASPLGVFLFGQPFEDVNITVWGWKYADFASWATATYAFRALSNLFSGVRYPFTSTDPGSYTGSFNEFCPIRSVEHVGSIGNMLIALCKVAQYTASGVANTLTERTPNLVPYTSVDGINWVRRAIIASGPETGAIDSTFIGRVHTQVIGTRELVYFISGRGTSTNDKIAYWAHAPENAEEFVTYA